MGTILENVFYGCCALLCLTITFWLVLGCIASLVDPSKDIWKNDNK